MVTVKHKVILEKWFFNHVTFSDCFRPVKYKSCPNNEFKKFFRVRDVYTKIIDLNLSQEEIISGVKKSCMRKINRFEDRLVCCRESDLSFFLELYNNCAKQKGMTFLDHRIFAYKDQIKMTKVVHNDEILSLHMYLLDECRRRARLFKSMTLCVSDQPSSEKRFAGCANRTLLLNDILFFKNAGFAVYDFGGYAFQTESTKLENINKFKDEFGGGLIKEYDIISYPLLLGIKLTNYLKH